MTDPLTQNASSFGAFSPSASIDLLEAINQGFLSAPTQ